MPSPVVRLHMFVEEILKTCSKMGSMLHRLRVAGLVSAPLALVLAALPAVGLQSEPPKTATRKAKVSNPPEYPQLARKKNLHGVVRVLATVAPDGKVVAVKELGGNPVLLGALVDAVKKWRYEPADHESTIEVSYEFK